MPRYNKVRIGSVWLTSNGDEDGFPCKVTITGINFLKTDKTGSIKPSADGTPYLQLIDVNHKGTVIEIKPEFTTQLVFDNIVDEHNDAKNNQTTIEIEVQGLTGNFTFLTLPNVPTDIEFEGFIGETIKGLIFRYVIT